MIAASPAILALVASVPTHQFIADLFTFQLRNGQTFRWTNAMRSITLGGNTYTASKTRIRRGRIKVSRGMSIDSHSIQLTEADGVYLAMIRAGYFNLATYRLERAFAPDANLVWAGPQTRFFGVISSFDEITRTYAKMTAKSMLNVLDNDFPRKIMQKDCDNTLFDASCGLSRAAFLVSGSVAAGSTRNTILSALVNPDNYFTQGVISFTSGALSGISYMVKYSRLAGGSIFPAYPLLAAPAAGDTFQISPGCDKTLASGCIAKYGYNPSAGTAPFFGGQPYIPDPTVVY